MSGGSYSGGGGYVASSGSGATGASYSRTPGRFGRGSLPKIPGVSEDDLIDINKYLSQFTSPPSGTGSVPRGTGFELGDYSRNFTNPDEKYSSDVGTGLSFYKPSPSYGGFDGGFDRSAYAPFSSSSNFSGSGSGSGLNSTTATGGFTSGGSRPFSSDSRVASTGLSNSSPARSPFIGLPGGISGVSRFAGAGSMNPGAFRGTGVGGSANALTGGLGMGPATTTANPSTGFGGVQTTPASQTTARPMMPGMMNPMTGSTSSGGKKGKQDNGSGIQSSDTNILADINSFGTQRVEEENEAESSQVSDSTFTALRR